MTSGTSILTIAFGIATSKVVAVVAGPEGVGLLGLYRTLCGILTAVLPLGLNDIVVRRLSTARDSESTGSIVGASITFLLFQSVLVLLLAAFGARTVAAWLFAPGAVAAHVLEVQLVLGLAIGILALQNVSACLNGLFRLREVNRLNLLTSFFTLATVYPLLLLGRVGLAFVIGLTCFLGAALGSVYLRHALGTARLVRPRNWDALRLALPISPWLALHPLLNTGSAMAVQIVLSRHYGSGLLGAYNAASMFESTSIMVLMSSMRSYYLPGLGRFTDFTHKRQFANKILLILLLLLLVGSAVLVLAAPQLVNMLFSAAFQPASDIVRILAISMVGQVLAWCAAMFLLHNGDYKTYVCLDLVWVVVRVAGTAACAVLEAPVSAVAWVHAGSFALSAVCYIVAIRVRYGTSLVDKSNLLLSVLVLGLLLGAQRLLPDLHGWQLAFPFAIAALSAWASSWAWRRVRT